jgi:hypothetical protein
MARSEQARCRHAALQPARFRARAGGCRIAAALFATLFVVLALGFAQRTTGAARVDAVGALSAPAVSGRAAVVVGSGANALLSWSHAVGHRRVDLGDLTLGVVAAAAALAFVMQAKRGARRGPRFDALFVLRRGPPILLVAD